MIRVLTLLCAVYICWHQPVRGQNKVVYRALLDEDGFQAKDAASATMYKLYDSVEGSKFHVQQWHIKPEYLMYDGYALISSSKPEVKNGYFKYYDESGHKTKEGEYLNDGRQGMWIYYFSGTDDIKCTMPFGGVKKPYSATWYYPSNQVRKVVEYMPDSARRTTCYDEQGGVIPCTKDDQVFTMPGPAYDFMNFLAANINYPEDAKAGDIQGRVLVQFMVHDNGTISNIHVLQGIGGGCDEEAMRVIRLMPKWIPGTVDGVETDVTFTQPITFRLEGNGY
jgi:TonB family protein